MPAGNDFIRIQTQKVALLEPAIPQDSNALTLSPAQLHGQAPMDEAVGRPDPKYKLQTDPHRKIITSDANTLEAAIWRRLLG